MVFRETIDTPDGLVSPRLNHLTVPDLPRQLPSPITSAGDSPPKTTLHGQRRWHWGAAAILTISLVLRMLLAAKGGQYFFGDETRYDRGIQLYNAIRTGDFATARALGGMPEHSLFTALGAVITAGQHLLAHFTPYGDWSHPEFISFTTWIAAVLLSLVCTLNLYWIYRLARFSGSSWEEAFWALALAASATTLFYPARHLLPYCAALSTTLAALAIGLAGPSPKRALACGLLAGLTFHLYNGYWYLPPTTGVAYLWWWRREARAWPRGWSGIAGAALGGGLPFLIGTLCGGKSYWTMFFAFSGTVTQGLFAEGWSLPWEFLWHAEGLFGAAIAVGIAIALIRRPTPAPPRVTLWLLVLAVSYGLLVLLSNGLDRFVVYGRTVLPLVPFFCLLGGWALARFVDRRAWRRSAALIIVTLAAWLHFQPHFGLVFPREMEIATLRHYGNPKHSLSVSGSLYQPLAWSVTRPDLVLVNAQLLYPVRDYIGYPAGKIVLRIEHPLSYLPFQYESHTPRERQLLRSHDIAMVLIATADPTLPNDLPVPLRFDALDRPKGR